jgi:oxygen-dependent protoporphyrinogen oxidase
MVGGAKDHQTPSLPDEELTDIVKGELADTMSLTAAADFISITRWEKAIPLYTVGHLGRIEEAEAKLPAGVVLTGNAYHGVGINDCVREAEVAARRAVDLVIGLS